MMAGTYEVFIDVRHHPRHCDEWEQREQTGFKLVDTGEPLRMVADCLRDYADELDPPSGVGGGGMTDDSGKRADAENASVARCKSRGSYDGVRWRCTLPDGHDGWHENPQAAFSWDAKGGYKVDRVLWLRQ